MRRGLAILLVLFFGLGPLAATLQASDESRLPDCCRRHGAHHCAMSDAMRSQMAGPASDSKAAFTAPTHCPFYPGSALAALAHRQALAGSAPAPLSLAARTLARLPHPEVGPGRTLDRRAGRGPPEHFSA